MGSHPINLALRFLLELAALFSAGMWGWNQSNEWPKYFLALGIPVILAAMWGIFAVPGDPSRSGSAPIITPGIVRLCLELTIFGFATWSLYDLGWNRVGLILGIVVVLHYAASYDRLMWLLNK